MSDTEKDEARGPAGRSAGEPADGQYLVLARKHRPADFAAMIGQDALVRTLTNAFASGRLAHAFVLTGVRGVGKTTTARIIARGLNCVGADGKGEPTITPCGICENCQAIAEDRHQDVLEMDAASRTGVDDIRELIEGARYRPVIARYKIYIIDEVHMLSRNAFNALLKTLEEPPEHVKFIFATTEIRKVPVTVLSRCQRFDLRRIDADTLDAYFTEIARREEAPISAGAISLIARVADGSARDGLSLLDQAIASGNRDEGEIDEENLRQMLGLADREKSFDLLEKLMKGDVAEALSIFDAEYASGADPLLLLGDLLEITHWLTRIKVVPEAAEGRAVSEMDRRRGTEMAAKLSMADLARAWQMLLKGLGEAQMAPSPARAVEMVLVRLAYTADLPSPADAVRALAKDGDAPPAPTPPALTPPASTPPAPAPPDQTPEPASEAKGLAEPASFDDVVRLAGERNERLLMGHLVNHVHLVSFEPGHIEIRPSEAAPRELASDLIRLLNEATGRRWVVGLSSLTGAETMGEARDERDAKRLEEIETHPLVRSIMETFPGATIEAVREPGAGMVPEDKPEGEEEA